MIRATTRTGTRYAFDSIAGRTVVQRLPPLDPEGGMRRDGDWLDCTIVGKISLGHPIRMILEPLGGHGTAGTWRTTSPVVRIQEEDE